MASRVEVAKHLFMSTKNIQKLIEKGVFITKTGRNPLDLDNCRQNYINYLQKLSRYTNQSGSGDIAEEKTRLTKAQADKAQLDVQVIEGKLVPTEEVEETWVNYVANCRGKLLSLPTKVAHLCLASEDFAEVEKILKDAIHEALEELSQDALPQEYRENTILGDEDMESSS